MCGIVGFFDTSFLSSDSETPLRKMLAQLVHRGPNEEGIWVDLETRLALGHRRLSILDLSPAARQPMTSSCGRYVIVFNGEIYNHQALRGELDSLAGPCSWRGHSDTEVILSAISHWGFASTLERLVGMFAIGVWDKQQQTLLLARDRIGEKPLYYGWARNVFLFGSELKALRAHPCWHGEINRDVLALYLRHNCVPAPYSIYRDIFKLSPGTYLRLPITTLLSREKVLTPAPYWSAKRIAEAGLENNFAQTETEALSNLELLLKEAISLQMVADVPVGAFLSGGVDSSLIVALMQAQSARAVRTFTIGFDNAAYNEAVQAAAVARHLGTEHTELYVSASDALAVIPRLPTLYDEPFSDSSQIPTFLLAALAREHVAVSLSGDGGDELFGGYNRHTWGPSVWNKIRWLPRLLRSAVAAGLLAISPGAWDKAFGVLSRALPAKARQRTPGDKIHKLASMLSARSSDEAYLVFVSHWATANLVIDATPTPTILANPEMSANLPTFAERMMYFDLVTYLPDDILAKVDRATMGVSLEARAPFLDHRVVEFAWHLPLNMKIRAGQSKWALRQLLYRYVPKELIERPKMGFGVPIDEWLRGPLRDWAEGLLSEDRLRREGYFQPEIIRRRWAEHKSEKRNWQHHLWDILMFQAWLEHETQR